MNRVKLINTKAQLLNELEKVEGQMNEFNSPNLVDSYLPLMEKRKSLVINIREINSQLY